MNNNVNKRTFIHNAIDLVALGAHSLERDDFSDCFAPVSVDEMPSSGGFYVFSFIIRYFVLFPIRLVIIAIGIMFIGTVFLYGKYFRNYQIIQDCFILANKLLIFALNCKITNIGTKKKINAPHVYVSNHTSYIDYIVLSSHKFSHACLAENHSGLFGFIMKYILSENGSIGFRRSDKQDREHTKQKIKEHIHGNMAPMLMFPEGTCVNNESVVLFQKGAFELDTVICPVGIRYKKDMMDPYWNRRIHGFSLHLFYLLTRWKIEVEVHWMEPTKREENEAASTFAHRVKLAIAREMNLKNTIWNGYFKSSPMLKDRELFKACYEKVLNKILKEEESAEETNIYLRDENIDDEERDDKTYFNGTTYRNFINECNKEYLRMKEQIKYAS